MQYPHYCADQTINVKQREYGFRKPRNVNKQLISKNYWSCIGVAGVHKSNGAAFLCHFDLPWTAWAIDDLVGDIQKHSLDPKDFEIYVYGGFWWGVGLALALLGWYGGMAIGISAAVVGAVPGGAYALTLLATRLKLTNYGFNKPKRIKYWSYTLKDGRHFQVYIGAHANGEPEVKSQTPKGYDKNFKEEGAWYQKAHKSKDSD